MSELDNSSTATTIWYKSPWGILVFCFPIASVIMGGVILYIAISNPDSLVQDNYYKEGLAINQQIDDLQAARELGLAVQLTIENGLVSATINPPIEDTTQQIAIAFYHNLNEKLDTHVVLNRQSETQFIATMAPLKAASWYIDITPTHAKKAWRIKGKINSQQSQWQLSAE